MEIRIDQRMAAGYLLGILSRQSGPITRAALFESFLTFFHPCFQGDRTKARNTFDPAVQLLFAAYGVVHDDEFGLSQNISLNQVVWGHPKP